jgi:hypothetical protein
LAKPKKSNTAGLKRVKPLTSSTLEKDSNEVLDDEIEGKEEFEKENP